MFKDISKLFKFTVHEELGIEVPEGVKKFQNFSSLQFIIMYVKYNTQYIIFQNFSSLQFMEILQVVLKLNMKDFKTFQVYSS